MCMCMCVDFRRSDDDEVASDNKTDFYFDCAIDCLFWYVCVCVCVFECVCVYVCVGMHIL